MANDRLYIKCECGERILLLKYWPSEPTPWGDTDTNVRWLHNHLITCGRAGARLNVIPFAFHSEATVDE